MTNCEIIYSLCDYAQEFIRKYKNPMLDQKIIDAIVVGYVNSFAGIRYGIDISMDTEELRNGEKMLKGDIIIPKDTIFIELISFKDVYINIGIIDRIIEDRLLNECADEVEADDKEVIKVVSEFIKGYIDF